MEQNAAGRVSLFTRLRRPQICSLFPVCLPRCLPAPWSAPPGHLVPVPNSLVQRPGQGSSGRAASGRHAALRKLSTGGERELRPRQPGYKIAALHLSAHLEALQRLIELGPTEGPVFVSQAIPRDDAIAFQQ